MIVLLYNSASFAATFNINNGDVTALINAINIANANGEADIINLAPNGLYVLTTINNTVSDGGAGGSSGLPMVLNNAVGLDITFNGNGATIQRTSAALFRIIRCTFGVEWVFNDIKFLNGSLVDRGGAIYNGWITKLTLNNCEFRNNSANKDDEWMGGAVCMGSRGTMIVENCKFINNSAYKCGGAIALVLADLKVTNSYFENNQTTGSNGCCGGAIYLDGAGNGDGNANIYSGTGIVEIKNSQFVNNVGKSLGGAVFLQAYNDNTYTIDNCLFSGNKSPSGQGGALWHNAGSNSTLNIKNSSFDKNETTGGGGAMSLAYGTINITNCTMAENKAEQGGAMVRCWGDACDNRPANVGMLTIANCTIASNEAVNGGYAGAWVIGKSNFATVKNTIIANNTSANPYNIQENCAGVVNDGGNNIEFPERLNTQGPPLYAYVTDLPCFTRPYALTSNTLPVINPMLSPLADNGGPTKTMALQVGSPAINAGSGCATLDQRGGSRVNACDIGAFEFGATLGNAVNTIATKTLKLYPNPAVDGKITIEMPFEINGQSKQILLINLLGATLSENSINPFAKSYLLDLGKTDKGVYLVAVNSGQSNFVAKIIID